jgi:hypothetical protein
MNQPSTQPNPTSPINEPNKVQPSVGPQTDAEKKALADKAANKPEVAPAVKA